MPNDNTSSWMDFAQRSRDDGGLGLASHQAAGLVGNLVNESGSGLPSWGPAGDNGSAWGTAQWRGDRLDSLKKAFPDSYQTPQAQQAFMRQEFDGPENSSYRALQAAQTPEDAASAVNHLYERSADRSGNREATARALYQDGPTAIQAAMRRPTGQAMGYAATNDEEDTPPNSAPTNGVLSSAPASGALTQSPNGKGDWLSNIGDTLMNMAPGLASISSPAQAQALATLAAASKKNGGSWTTSGVDPKTGVAVQTNSLTGQTRTLQVHAPQPDDNGKWGIVGKDKYGQPTYGYPPTREEAEAAKTAAPAAPADDSSAVSLTGQPFLDQLSKDKGAGYQSQVQSILDGRTPYPTGMLLKTPFGQQLAQDVTQADPSFETGNAMSRVKTRNEFAAGGVGSPAGQITAGNTAIQHAGEMSDALEQFKGNGADYSGVPFASYYMNKAHNAAIQGTGTPESQAYNNFKTAKNHFAEEVTKFYSGSSGSEAERTRALSNLDEAKSLPELRAAIQEESQLMQGKVSALQDRWRTGMGPLVKDYPLIQSKSQDAMDRISKRAEASAAGLTAAQPALPKGVRSIQVVQ